MWNELISSIGKENLPVYVYYNLERKCRLKPNEVSDYYKAFGKKCNLKINPHKFRHSVGNNMADINRSSLTISNYLGDGIEVVNKHYANDSNRRVRQASEKYIAVVEGAE